MNKEKIDEVIADTVYHLQTNRFSKNYLEKISTFDPGLAKMIEGVNSSSEEILTYIKSRQEQR